MTSKKQIKCIFYSHVWAVHMLSRIGIGKKNNEIVIELSTDSNIASVVGEQGKSRYGLAGILRLSVKLENLSQEFKNIPVPIILAPKPNVSADTLNSAVGILATSNSFFDNIYLLVHLNEAKLFSDAYLYVDQFQVFWDVADPPTAGLITMAEALIANRCISEKTWGGFHWYQHPRRMVSDADERIANYQNMLQEYEVLIR